ncbi:MAG: hypothetical protein L0191_15190 [Acidobacteria bacterium]|nr:hypothetical protein [Acidobacteriota bacterium]MCI0567385.1 hypothetical protein [Acidobacteriota bacterium]
MSTVQDGVNCLYFGMAIGLDANHLFINPPPSSLSGEMVLSPMVSVNPDPIGIAGGVIPSDVATELTATRISHGARVDWITSNERMTLGFDVIGLKRGGREIPLNSTLIPAEEGTTGEGASYSVTFDPGQLKGCNAINVELVLTDRSRKRFGPVGF